MAYQQFIRTVDGDHDDDILVYTLSTCIWCRKTKELLRKLGLRYRYVDVDLLDSPTQQEVYDDMEEIYESATFPTLVVNGGDRVIKGYKERDIKQLVKP